MTKTRNKNPQRKYQGPPFRAFSIAALASLSLTQSAASQQHSPDAPVGENVTPRGQRTIKDVTFGDWKKVCFKPGGAKQLCRTSITGAFSTGRMAVRLDIITPEGGSAKRIQILSPAGMYLSNPVELTIDQGKPYRVPYTWCLSNACVAGIVASPLLMKEMNKGQLLRMQFVDSSLLTLSTSVSLSQFSSVFNGAPAKTFEQDIDE